MADERAVSDKNAALILEFAAHVDKNVFADVDVLSAVSVKRREQREALIHRSADELGKEGAQFLRLVGAAIDLSGDAQGLLADAVHKLMCLATSLYRGSAVQVC